MGDIQKIVQTVPANELPEDVRTLFAPGTEVTLTYEGEAPGAEQVPEPEMTPERIKERKDSLMRFWGIAAHKNTSIEEAVQRIRALRDEWD